MSIQSALRYTVYGALFIIPFLPLYVASGLFFPFITGKGFAFRILVEIATFSWLLLALSDKKYRPRFSWVLVIYAALAVWMCVANIFAINPHKAFWSNYERMDGWITLIHVFAFFLVSGAVLSVDKLWRTWWMTFLGASALLSFYCLLQLSGSLEIHQGGVRVDGTFGNAAYLAAYMLFAVAVSLWHALESKGFLRYALFALAALETVIIFFTATRGAVLGLVGGIAVGSLLWMVESGSKGRKIAGGVLVGVVLIAGGFYVLRESSFVQSEPTLARVTSISVKDLSVRSTLWGMALQGAMARPVTGWGQEGFNYVFNTYYTPSLYAQEPWFDRAHNVFIDWLVAGGFPALLLFLGLFVSASFALYRREASRAERVMLLAAMSAYAIQAIVVFDNLFTYVPLAAILATAHAASSRPWKRVEKVGVVSESTLQVALPLTAVVAIAFIWMVNIPNISAASELVRALSITSNDITPNIAADMFGIFTIQIKA
jgi:O-antigen ligase